MASAETTKTNQSTNQTARSSKRNRFKIVSYVVVALILVLVAARVALPSVMKWYANKTLDSIPGYYGEIQDIDVALWRGAYRVHELKLVKVNGSEKEPFFSSDVIKIQLDWTALWNGKLKTKIDLIRPELQFIQRETKAASQVDIDKSWQKKIQKLYPFEINEFTMQDGLIRYKDVTSNPKINIYFKNLDLQADNISNAVDSKDRLPSTAKLSGGFLESGRVNADLKLNALSIPFEADLNASIKKLNLKELNNFTKAYAAFDFEKGTVQVTTELAATTKNYRGYVKTILRDVDVLDVSKERKEGDNVVELLWEGLVGSAMEIFQNQKRDQFAARIPLSGPREGLEINSWATVGSIVKNAFFKALDPKLEDSVTISNETQSATTQSATASSKKEGK